MTELLYLQDSYLKECDATIQEVLEGKSIVLDRTVFYTRGGGQPEDHGIITSRNETYHIVEVIKKEGKVLHLVDKEGLEQGNTVHCIIDWERRYQLMKMHTVSHVLSAILHNKTGALITGNQLGLEQSREDFSVETYDVELLHECIKEANNELAKYQEVTITLVPREEALQKRGMIKLAGVLPPSVKELRVVTIGTVDEQADGGTHVHNTKECGKVVFIKAQNKGKNNRRLYFCLEE